MFEKLFATLSNKDLNILVVQANEEKERRDKQLQEEDWDKVLSALAEFTHKWGSVCVYTTEMDNRGDYVNLLRGNFSSPGIGEIKVDA